MAFVAGATTRIAVNSCVIVLPYHEPIALAKAVATLDVLIGRSVLLTFGVGHAEEEFEALGVPFNEAWPDHRRVPRGDEGALDRGRRRRTTASSCQFKDVQFEPKPLQQPHPRDLDRRQLQGRAAARGAQPAAGCRGSSPRRSCRRASTTCERCRATTPDGLRRRDVTGAAARARVRPLAARRRPTAWVRERAGRHRRHRPARRTSA